MQQQVHFLTQQEVPLQLTVKHSSNKESLFYPTTTHGQTNILHSEQFPLVNSLGSFESSTTSSETSTAQQINTCKQPERLPLKVRKTFSNGEYEGTLMNGLRHGLGWCLFTNKGCYFGEWSEDQPHGEGTYTSSYIVDQRLPTEQHYPNHDYSPNNLHFSSIPLIHEKYVGEWYHGIEHGYGTFTWSDGSQYSGTFYHGQKLGQGSYTSAEGDSYQGQFSDGKPHGQGTYTWADGEIYSGQWLEGLQHGFGTSISSEGDVSTGQWDSGFKKSEEACQDSNN